jgi:hypothetical protein
VQRIRGDDQDGHSRDAGDGGLQQVELFAPEIAEHESLEARDIAAWSRQARDQSEADGVCDADEHDGDGGGCGFGSSRGVGR